MVERIDKNEYDKKKAIVDIYNYLSPYRKYVNSFTKNELNILDNNFPKLNNYIIFGNTEFLNKIAIHFLKIHKFKNGNVNCKYKNYGFGDFIDGCFNSDYSESSYYKNCESPLMIIYISKSSCHLKNEQYITTAFENRYYSKLPSIILSEVNPDNLKNLVHLSFMEGFDFRGKKIKDLNGDNINQYKINKNQIKLVLNNENNRINNNTTGVDTKNKSGLV